MDPTQVYNDAVARLQRAVEVMRTASGTALTTAEAEFRSAQTACEDALAVVERREELDAVSQRFQPTPIGAGGSPLTVNGEPRFRTFGQGESIAEFRRSERGSIGEPGVQLDIGRAMRAMALNDWSGAEAEQRAMTGVTGSAGGFLVPALMANFVLDLGRAESVCMKAGARTIPFGQDLHGGDTMQIARLLTDPAIAWVAAGGEITPSDPTFGAVTLTAKKLTCIVVSDRELLRDAPNADLLLRQTLSLAFAAEIDRVMLEGSGVGAEPLGLAGKVGVGSVSMDTNGAAPTNDTGPAKLSATALEVRQSNYTPSAVISSPRSWSLFHNLKDSTKQPLRFGAGLDELPWYQSSNCSDARDHGTSHVAGNVYTGDFSKLLLGVHENFEIYVTRDAYLTNDQVAFLCTWRGDVAVEQESAFAILSGVTAS